MNDNDKIFELMTKLYNEMNDIKSEVKGIKSEVNDINSEVKGIKSEVNDINSEVKDIKSEVNDINSEVKDIKSEVKDIKSKVKDIQMTLENETNKNIKIIAEGHFNLNRKLDNSLKVENEKELLLIRVTILENEVRRLRARIEEIA